MIKYLLAAATVVAIGVAGAAFAEEATAKKPTAMTEAEMDQITAGKDVGQGIDTATQSGAKGNQFPVRLRNINSPDGFTGLGRTTSPALD